MDCRIHLNFMIYLDWGIGRELIISPVHTTLTSSFVKAAHSEIVEFVSDEHFTYHLTPLPLGRCVCVCVSVCVSVCL